MMNLESIAAQRPATPHAVPVQPDLTAIRSSVAQREGQARTLIRQRPAVAVLVAAAVGYLLARVVARGTR